MTVTTIQEMHQDLVQGKTTAKQLVEEAFDRIDELDDTIQAFLTLDREGALQQAEAIDQEGVIEGELLKGIPLAVKDNYLTKDVKTTAASKMLENFIPTFDAESYARLKTAGMIMVGKVNMDEFAMGATGETSAFKRTVNVYDHSKVPGGSSGGSAAAVASGMVPVALGSDTGGSVRQPAAFNNLVGIKPSYGRVSRQGIIGMASSLDCPGVLAHTVCDAASVLEVMAGHDFKDMTSLEDEVPDYLEEIEAGLSGMTFASIKEINDSDAVSSDMKERFQAALQVIEDLGGQVKDVSIPRILYSEAMYGILNTTEGNTALQRYDGIRFTHRTEDYQDLEELYIKSRSEGFGDEVKSRILRGMHATTTENKDAFHTQAARVRTRLIEDFKQAFQDVDFLLTPMTATVAYDFEDGGDHGFDDILAASVNLAGLASITVPMGFIDGLPSGLQVIAKPLDEQRLFQAAYAYEQATGYGKEQAKGDA